MPSQMLSSSAVPRHSHSAPAPGEHAHHHDHAAHSHGHSGHHHAGHEHLANHEHVADHENLHPAPASRPARLRPTLMALSGMQRLLLSLPIATGLWLLVLWAMTGP